METLLYLGIFAIVGGLLVSVLLGTLRVQTEDQAARVVSEEGRFVTETVKRLVREASLIDMSTTTAQGTLILRLPKRNDGNSDFVHIYVSGSAIYAAEGVIDDVVGSSSFGASSTPCDANLAGRPCTLSRLTSDAVSVDSLSFMRHSNAPGHDTLQIDLTLSHVTDSPQAEFSRDFRTAIARVSAAVFDSALLPNPGSNLDVGASGQRWASGWFSGNLTVGGDATFDTNVLKVDSASNNVGVGTAIPAKKLHVSGGEVYIETSGEGLILKSPDGSICKEFTLNNSGNLASTTITCP